MKVQRQRIRLVAAAAALALGATLGGSALASEPGKLLVWINGDKGYNGLQKIGDEFAKKTGVQVTVEHPEDAPGKFQQAAAAGKGPDIWIWPHDRIGEWIAGGLLQPVTPSKKVVADIDPLALKAFTVGGKVWGYPMSIEAVALVYNKALVPTPPKTFDEVIALDKKLSAQGKKAILWDYNNTYFTWPLLAANGGYPFKLKADGNYDPADTGVANAGAVKGAELLDKLIKSGVMPKGASYADMEAGMSQGKVAMMINGPWSWDNLKKSNIDFGVARIPSVGGQEGRALRRRARRHDQQVVAEPRRGRGVHRELHAQRQGPEDDQRRRAAGHAGEQGALRRAQEQPEHPGHHGLGAGRRADAQQPGDGPLLVVDGVGAAEHDRRAPVGEGGARRGGEAHRRQVMRRLTAARQRRGEPAACARATSTKQTCIAHEYCVALPTGCRPGSVRG